MAEDKPAARCTDGGRGSTFRFGKLSTGRRPPGVALALVCIVAAGLLLRLIWPFGILWVDSFTYADAAASMSRWEPVFSPRIVGDVYYTQYVRLTLIAPAALICRLFGEGDAGSSLFPLVLSLAVSPLAFWFTRRYSSTTAGLAAAALVAIFPWSVIISTLFMPDGLVASFLAIATVCLIVALYDDGLSHSQAAALWFGVGAAFALAFYARATAICFLPGFGLVSLLRWRRLRPQTLFAIAGGGAVLVAFQLLLVGLGSDPLEDFRVLLSIGSHTRPRAGGFDFARFLLYDGKFWPFTVAAAIGVAGFALTTRPRDILKSPLAALALIALFEYFYFEFFMDLPGTATFRKEQRYILPLAFPMLTFAGIGIGLLLGWLRERSRTTAVAAGAAIAAALLFTAVRGLRDEYGYWVSSNHRVDAVQMQVVKFLAPQPPLPIYVSNDDFARPLSTRLGSAGTYYERNVSRTGRLRNRFDASGQSEVVTGSFVVVLPVETWWALPTAPATDWTKVWQGADGTAVYRVGGPAANSNWPIQRLDPSLNLAGTRLVAAGLSQGWLLPGRHSGLELDFEAPVPEETNVSVALQCNGEVGPAESLTLPAGTSVFRRDVVLVPPVGAQPSTCDLVARASVWTPIASVTFPTFALVQAEDLANTAYAVGWERYSQPFFSRGGALLERAKSSTVSIPIPKVGPANYWVDLLVYDYGTGQGTIRATLNGKSVTMPWGTTDGAGGVVRATLEIPDAPPGDQLSITFDRGSQPAVLLDAVALVSEPPPPGG